MASDEVVSEVRRAIAAEPGGQVVLVLGAGCSHEAPTSLPLSRELALDVHARLIADGVLQVGDCDHADDLSAVADAVHRADGSHLRLVQRLPLARLQNATPNEGHRIAAALLREGALGAVLTLNFDLALTHALSALGAGAEVSVVRGPEDFDRLGITNLVFLHRDVNSDPKHWILRTVQLEEAWRDGWEELIATRVATSPVVVFAGLGSPSAVLIHTAGRIQAALANLVVQVDVSPYGGLALTGLLGITPEKYIALGWIGFMRELGGRFVTEQVLRLRRIANDLKVVEGLAGGDVEPFLRSLQELGVLGFGLLRARFLLSPSEYEPSSGPALAFVADLILVIALIQDAHGYEAVPRRDGLVELRRANELMGVILPVSGKGIARWAAIEGRIRERAQTHDIPAGSTLFAIAANVVGARTPLAPPDSILGSADPADIAGPMPAFAIFAADELRADPRLALEPA